MEEEEEEEEEEGTWSCASAVLNSKIRDIAEVKLWQTQSIHSALAERDAGCYLYRACKVFCQK